jgi:hypothetical protein
MVTIGGQIHPLQYLNPRTIPFIKFDEHLLSVFQREITLGDVGVCREIIRDIPINSVKHLSISCCHIGKPGSTSSDARKQHRDD